MQLLNLTVAPPCPSVVYAGFSQRFMAKVIDFFLVKLSLLPLDMVLGTSFASFASWENRASEQVFIFVVFCVYSAILESSKLQATVGKRMLGILVSDTDEKRISFRRALLRSFMQFVGPIDYLVALVTSRKQALHDLAAETEVVPGTL